MDAPACCGHNAAFPRDDPLDAHATRRIPSVVLSALAALLAGGSVLRAQGEAEAIQQRLDAATAGAQIVIPAGTLTLDKPLVLRKGGAKEAPVTIKAQMPGRTIIAGKAGLRLEGVEHVVIEGLTFRHDNFRPAIDMADCRNVQIVRNRFQLQPSAARRQNWVYVTGGNSGENRIEFNLFEGKKKPGAYIAIDGSEKPPFTPSRKDRIANNHFRGLGGEEGVEGVRAIRLGWSALAEQDAGTLVEFNLFDNCDDDEYISVRGSGQTIRYNTFKNCAGYMTLRQGKGNTVEGNFFFTENDKQGVGGVRIYGAEARVFNNYFENLSEPAVDLPNGHAAQGRGDVARPAARAARIVHNTLVNCSRGSIALGGAKDRHWTDAPADCEIANNIVISFGDVLVKMYNNDAGVQWAANIMWRADDKDNIGVTLSDSQAILAFPKLRNAGGIWRIAPGSPAIDAAVDAYGFVELDVDGQARVGKKDIGADEYAQMPVKHQPLTADVVGPDAQ